MFKKIHISNVFGLQIFQVLRFVAFTIISIFLTKSSLSLKDIGDYELLLFIASAVSYFWVTGIIQSLLPLFNNNASYPFRKQNLSEKSPEIFNAFILLFFFSFLISLILFFLKDTLHVYKGGEKLPYLYLMLLYILISNPISLVEYIYLLYNKSKQILYYGFFVFALQVILVILPLKLGYSLEVAIWGLLTSTALRAIWLFILLKKYSVPKISFPYLKEHINLAMPLIISTLLSGSAQYIDGIIVSAKFSPAKFAMFRYGAKEMPLVVMLASGLNNAMLPLFNSVEKIKFSLLTIKKKSVRLMHVLFPISIFLLLFSNKIFPALFTERFNRASDIFMIYLLLITSRLLFPQTILIGLKQTKTVMFVSLMEIVLNVSLSLLFIPIYGITGVAVATVIMFLVEKFVLVGYNYYKFKIKPIEYIPIITWFTYSLVITVLFILIDHRIIMVRP